MSILSNMRDLKFRAWDKFNGCYWYSENYPNLAAFFTAMQRFIDAGNELVFEQYTGLKDKNGKEIYEGDIVASYYFTEQCGEVKRHDSGEWYLDYGSANEDSKLDSLWAELKKYKCEVTGNIYEILSC